MAERVPITTLSDKAFREHIQRWWRELVDKSSTQTLSNKSIDGDTEGVGIKVRHFTAAPTWADEAAGLWTSSIAGVQRIGYYDGTHNYSIVLPDTDAI